MFKELPDMFACIDIDYLSSPEACTLKRIKHIQDYLSVICFSPNNSEGSQRKICQRIHERVRMKEVVFAAYDQS